MPTPEPLMLQAVLGLDAALIGSAFLVAPTTMGQRLVRAKTKIRSAKIRFEIPDEKELAERLAFVLESIYAAYGVGWDDICGAQSQRKDLTAEAIYLGRLLVQKMPTEPEALGLLSLMLYCESRRAARRDSSGNFVPLGEQKTELWSKPLIGEAEYLLSQAAIYKKPGRFQWEAAIQSVHTSRLVGLVDKIAIVNLYESLVSMTPTIGAVVGLAAARAEAYGAASGLSLLQILNAEDVATYQPYWALRAHLLRQTDQSEVADDALSRAIGLCDDASVRAYLLEKKKLK